MEFLTDLRRDESTKTPVVYRSRLGIPIYGIGSVGSAVIQRSRVRQPPRHHVPAVWGAQGRASELGDGEVSRPGWTRL